MLNDEEEVGLYGTSYAVTKIDFFWSPIRPWRISKMYKSHQTEVIIVNVHIIWFINTPHTVTFAGLRSLVSISPLIWSLSFKAIKSYCFRCNWFWKQSYVWPSHTESSLYTNKIQIYDLFRNLHAFAVLSKSNAIRGQ